MRISVILGITALTVLGCIVGFLLLDVAVMLIQLGQNQSSDLGYSAYLYRQFYARLYSPIIQPSFYKARQERLLASANRGKVVAQQRRVVIVLLARDVAENIPHIRRVTRVIGSLYHEYHILLFENDSQDTTRQLLTDWQSEAPTQVTLMGCCTEGSCSCRLHVMHTKEQGLLSQTRLAKMANLRQRCQTYVREHFASYDDVLIMESDIQGGVLLDGLASIYDPLSPAVGWTAAFANGRIPLPCTFGLADAAYDAIAYVALGEVPLNASRNDCASHFFQQTYAISRAGDVPLQVTSAFNGLGVYRMAAFLIGEYATDNEMCEHVNFNISIVKANPQARLYIFPNLIVQM